MTNGQHYPNCNHRCRRDRHYLEGENPILLWIVRTLGVAFGAFLVMLAAAWLR